MVSDARKELQQAKDEATAAGAQTTPNESYRSGVADEAAGQRAFSANRRLDALPPWWSARDGFARAAREARDADTARKAEEERRLAEAKKAEDERKLADATKAKAAEAERQRLAQLEQERQRQAKAEADRQALDAQRLREQKAALDRRQADIQAIRQTLQRYEAAWASLNPDEVFNLHQLSGAGAASVRDTMKAAREYRLEIQDPIVQLEADGQRATVSATIKRSYVPRGSTTQSSSTRQLLTLMKRGDTWIISSITNQ
jgi:hypothetical protein